MATPFSLLLFSLFFVSIERTFSQLPVPNVLPQESEVRRIRSNLMYPYIKEDRKDDIHFMNPQVPIYFNFYFPYFGFNFNYTELSIYGSLSFSRTPALLTFPLHFPIDDWPKREDPAFIGIYYAFAQAGSGDSGTQEEEFPPGVYFKILSHVGTQQKAPEILQYEINLREALRQDIEEGMVGGADFTPKHVIIATWRNVTFGGSQNSKVTNTYQLVLTTDEIRTYVMFNYDRLNWYSSTSAGGSSQDGIGGSPAFVGFNAGNGTRAFEYKPYSQESKIRDLASLGYVNNHPGRHMFRIDEEILPGACNFEPQQSPLLVMSPESGHMLGGTVVNVTGPCFSDYRKQIKVKFHDVFVTCPYRHRNMATCVTPKMFAAGYVDVIANADVSGRIFTNKYYIENPMINTDHVSFENPEVLNNLQGTNLQLRWSSRNLTWNQNAPVSVGLWGYREYATKPDLVYITTLAEGVPNNGRLDIDLTQFHTNEDGWKIEFTFGLIQLNTTLSPINDIVLTPLLWSQPIPLGWYFYRQWLNNYGSDWANKLCDRWITDDRRLKNFAHQVPRCPCDLGQAIADKGRFAPDLGCDKWGNSECYGNQKIQHCVRSGQSSADGAGQQCCYSMDGNLVMNVDMKEGGTPSRSHPFGMYPYEESTKVPGLSHWYHDQSAYMVCCGWQDEMSEHCYQYKWRRASQDCIGYQPPNASVVFGDPHFITFDNYEYTFNGKGEFALVSIHNKNYNLDVQGRFEQLVDYQRKIKLPATMLTSIAASEGDSDTVEIQLRPREARWRYHLNVLVKGKRIYFDRAAQRIQAFKGITVYTPSYIYNQSHVIAMFQSGAGVEVIENNGYIASRIYLPKIFMNLTRGLMGNWSNDREDDLELPPHLGIPAVPISSSNERLHKDFGLHWMVSDSGDPSIAGSTSLFYHENRRSSSFFNDKNFIPDYSREPTFLHNMTITQSDIESVCGIAADNLAYQCRYDYLITQNKEFAQVSKFNADSFRKMKTHELKYITTCGALETPRHGRKSTNKYVVGTEVKLECEKGYILDGEPIRRCYKTGEWSWTEYGITRCYPEDEFYSRQAGITAGIVLGILIPIIIGAICLFGFIVSKGNDNGSSSRVYIQQGESHAMTRVKTTNDEEKNIKNRSTISDA